MLASRQLMIYNCLDCGPGQFWDHVEGLKFDVGLYFMNICFKIFENGYSKYVIYQYNHLVTKRTICLTQDYLNKIVKLSLYTKYFITLYRSFEYDSIKLVFNDYCVARESDVIHRTLVFISYCSVVCCLSKKEMK